MNSTVHADNNSLVDAPHECIGCQESNGAGEKTVNGAGQQGVAEEEHARDQALDVQVREEVVGRVEEDPDGAAAADEEGLPPPVVVLRFQEVSVSSKSCTAITSSLVACYRGGERKLTSAHNCIYVATMVTSATVKTRMRLTAARKPKT